MADTDQQIHDRADRLKADLSRGRDTRVARGDEPNPVARANPLDQRKAIFAAADRIRDTETGAPPGETVDPDMVAAMQAEAAGGASAKPIGDQGDRHAARTTPLQGEDGYVSITLEGGHVAKVSKADIERAGGEESYRRRRAIDAEAAEVAQGQQELVRQRRELVESQRLREESQRTSAGQGAPAPGTGPSPVQPVRAGENDAALESQADRLAKQIYSGDEGSAKTAILEILKSAQARGEVLTDRQVQHRVDTATAAPATTVPQIDARVARINASIDAMAVRDFPDLCNDPVAKIATWEKFKELVRLPANADRLAVDVARDACEWGETKFGTSRASVIERKRGLPSSVTASSATTLSDEEVALTPAQIVAQQQASRNFGRRAH